MKSYKIFFVAALLTTGAAGAADNPTPGVGPGANGARYATDAYPGFDSEDTMVKPERKEPRWFSFIFGPDRDNAADQLAYCEELIAAGKYSKACGRLDALVREWPTSHEAPKAQLLHADLCYEKLQDYEDAFAEYRYMLDFYSLQCDYEKVADRLYELAGILKIEGKEVMFVRFANTVDVRRAYETCILRAPGAKWVPDAMLTIGALREDEGKFGEAVKVYENLRNLFPDTNHARTAILAEAKVRMKILSDHAYNRARCQDTISFMLMAMRLGKTEDVGTFQSYLSETQALVENEDFMAAKFYDSTTRTRRSAISAYERFLAEHPQSERADWVRERLADLKGEDK